MIARAIIMGKSLLAVAAICAVSGTTADAAESSSAGSVRMVKAAESNFDRFTATSAHSAFMNDKYWRMRAYSPYFDSRTSWAPGAWSYQNLFAIYPGQSVERAHPEWILKDAQGRRLYIPFACGGGTCPQYAADIGNPAYRAWWIAEARRAITAGYAGIFVDDVNMHLNISDGTGTKVTPRDERTGAGMTETAWKTYATTLLEELRAALPSAEIVHNSLWFLGTSDPLIRRQIAAADLIELERGVNDGGLRGGGGTWGYSTVLSYVDALHELGAGVVYDSWGPSEVERAYNLASYFLTSNGTDGVAGSASDPDDWWAGYDADLGAPLGPRYQSDGLWRRDFARGTVVVNPPDAPRRSFTGAPGTRSVRGQDGTAATVSLGAAEGTILLGAASPARPTPAPTPTPTPAPTLPPAPAAAPAPASASSASATVQTSAGGPGIGHQVLLASQVHLSTSARASSKGRASSQARQARSAARARLVARSRSAARARARLAQRSPLASRARPPARSRPTALPDRN